MPRLILPPRYTEDSIALWKAAIRSGWDVERLQGWQVPPDLKGGDTVVYGEPLFAERVAQTLELCLLEPGFGWLPRLPAKWRAREVRLSTLEDARTIAEASFIKPADDKCFRARVYSSGRELPKDDILPGTIPVLISEPVTWLTEFRCFVHERHPATFSISARGGELAEGEEGDWPVSDEERAEAEDFLSRFLADPEVQVPPGVVVDFGRMADRGWGVVEANPAWSSGVYGCDPDEVLRVTRRACREACVTTPEDQDWVISRGA